jgi:ERCC4-type nuclease
LQKEEMKPRVGHLAIGDYVAEIGEALGFPRSPKRDFVVERKRFAGGRAEAWRRLLGIEGG